jgi:predicted transcriptional regulator
MVKRDQFGEMVMRDLLKQAHELRQRLTEVMMAANCPTI